MEFVFVLGKNPLLSAAEIESFLAARTTCTIIEKTDQYVLAETAPQDWSLLGGTLKVGQVIAPSLADVDVAALTATCRDKAAFSLHIFSEDNREEAGETIKRRLKELGVRLGFKKKELTHTELITKNMLEEGFELILLPGRVARTVFVHNPFEFRRRDLDRPCQRPIFSIPPRLARIMLNLAQALPGQTACDPFCGTGTILMEAVTMGLNPVGSDINPQCVQWARKNLIWLRADIHKPFTFNIIHADARSLQAPFPLDCIATEPDLGPPLKRPPTKREAGRILKQLEPLYTSFFRAAAAALKPGGKLCVVAPAFPHQQELLSFPVPALLKQAGLTTEGNWTDADPGDKTVRQIWLAAKPHRHQGPSPVPAGRPAGTTYKSQPLSHIYI